LKNLWNFHIQAKNYFCVRVSITIINWLKEVENYISRKSRVIDGFIFLNAWKKSHIQLILIYLIESFLFFHLFYSTTHEENTFSQFDFLSPFISLELRHEGVCVCVCVKVSVFEWKETSMSSRWRRNSVKGKKTWRLCVRNSNYKRKMKNDWTQMG
jgi:hypothetical protein